jgi:hypothetical protein
VERVKTSFAAIALFCDGAKNIFDEARRGGSRL